MVGRTDQRTGFDVTEAHGEGLLLQADELLRSVVADYLGVLLRGPQVLADRQHVDVMAAHVLKYVEQLILGLAKSDHESRLRDHRRRQVLDVAQERQAVCVDGFRPDPRVETRHRLGVVVEDVRPCLDDRAHRREISLEIGRQNFDGGAWAPPPDGEDGSGEDSSSAISEVIPVHRRDHRMTKPQLGHRLGDAQRLSEVQLGRTARGNRTETACARAALHADPLSLQ